MFASNNSFLDEPDSGIDLSLLFSNYTSVEEELDLPIPNMAAIQPNINPLDLQVSTSNQALVWKKWYKQFKLYLIAAQWENENDRRKVALMLSLIGQDAMNIFNSFNVDEETVKYNDLVKLFDDHFTPKKNLTVERHKFLSRRQQSDESIDDYVTDLKNLSLTCGLNACKTCDLKTLREDLVKDVLIVGLNSSFRIVKERLLQESDLKLDKAVTICKSYELSQKQVKSLEESHNSATNINAVNKKKFDGQRQSSSRYNQGSSNRNRSPIQTSPIRNRQYGKQSSTRSTKRDNRHQRSEASHSSTCEKCGQVHRFKCPAEGVRCAKCSKFNHFAKMCKTRTVVRAVNKSYYSDQGQSDESSDCEYFVGKLSCNNLDVWSIDIEINRRIIKCQLDTGAQTNCMSLDQYKQLNLDDKFIKPSAAKITAFCGSAIPNLGYCVLHCLIKNKPEQIVFNIIGTSCPTVLGLPTCQNLGLVKRVLKVEHNESYNNVLVRYKNVFEGLGCLSQSCKLVLKPNARPVIDPPRKLPFKLHKKVKEELGRMEHDGVIEKVNEPSEWVNSMVVTVKKSGSLRICLDPRNLNNNLMRSHYQLPTLSELRSELNGSTVFSTLDANSGFWIIPVDDESSKLLCFNTPFGRYRFKRLPFGISPAPEIFHRVMVECFGDIPGVLIFLDDLLVHGSTKKEHDDRLELVMKRAVKLNIKFNKSKCNLGTHEVKYMGHSFSKEGMRPDDSRVKAICDMPAPTDKKALQRFLGMINYLASFIPNLAEETLIVRDLIKQKSAWQWSQNHQKVFERLKKLITVSPVLSHFDVNSPIVLTVDSSQKAVGAALMQNNKPVAFASKTLTTTQQGYAQIEKEMYAVTYGCAKFRQYIYGQKITVETDHAPLVTICKKSLSDVPLRLQRMLLQLQTYDINVIYKPGKYMYVADTLSRAALNEVDNYLDDDISVHVNLITNNLPVSPVTLSKIRDAVNDDIVLKTLSEYCDKGWPKSKGQLTNDTQHYWSFRDEINVIDGLVYRNNSVLVPSKLKSEILKTIHVSHMGLDRTLSMVRGVLYWPQMSMEIKHMIESCSTCIQNKSQNVKEPLNNHEIPLLPWQKVAADFMTLNQQKYLIVVDYYSKFIEVAQIASNTASTTISHFKAIFSRHGIPLELVTDGGPPFSSNEFQNFVKSWGIKQTISSPYLPRSNGMAESAVKVIKNMFTKCKQSGSDPYLALLQQRNTPKGHMSSPAQLLMSRRLNCTLPINDNLLKPKVVNCNRHRKFLLKNQEDSKKYYDRGSRELSVLKAEDNIYFKHTPAGQWIPGTVIKVVGPRSYLIRDQDGNEYRRNRIHILARHWSPNNYKPSNNYFRFPNTISPVNNSKSPEIESPKLQISNTDNASDNRLPQKVSSRGRILCEPKRFTFSEFKK